MSDHDDLEKSTINGKAVDVHENGTPPKEYVAR